LRLTDLLLCVDGVHYEQKPSANVTAVCVDSRKCQPGSLFVAISGDVDDGACYIEDAISNGAVAILSEKPLDVPDGVDIVFHANPRQVAGEMLAVLHHLKPRYRVAVTGTNGKSSVVHFCREIWSELGKKGGSIGTLGAVYSQANNIPKEAPESVLTTPDVATLHHMLESSAREGCEYIAIEASSHGLAQKRFAGITVQAAGFTNLTQDHLDYHHTMEAYLAAKLKLFTGVLESNGVAVINADDSAAADFAQYCERLNINVWSYGHQGWDFRWLEYSPVTSGSDNIFEVFGRNYEVSYNLIGEFQISNMLCAIGLVLASFLGREEKISPEIVQKVIAASTKVHSPKGRMEHVASCKKGAVILVDYAHTPDALEHVLKAAKSHASEKLHVVFGCGGNRDAGKRPLMGKIAASYADNIIITDDNPRMEDAEYIRKQILVACPDAKEIADRESAIKEAIANLATGDVLVIAGKGHETFQIIGENRNHFSDAEIVINSVQKMEDQ